MADFDWNATGTKADSFDWNKTTPSGEAFDWNTGKTSKGGSKGPGLGARAIDLLSRPGRATQALLARGGGAGLETLLHSESDEQAQADRDQIKSGLGVKGLIDALPGGLVRGTADTAIDTLLDPTTYIGGAGAFEHLTGAAGRSAYVAVAKALAKGGDSALARLAREAHDVAAPGGSRMGALKRALAEREGAGGLDRYAQIRQIQKQGRNEAERTRNAFGRMSAKALEGLSDSDVELVGKVLNGELPWESLGRATSAAAAPPTLRAATQIRRLTNLDYALRNAATRQLPNEAGEIAMKELPYRKNYLPAAKSGVRDPDAPLFAYETLNPKDRAALTRELESPVESAKDVRERLETLAGNVSRVKAAKTMRDKLATELTHEYGGNMGASALRGPRNAGVTAEEIQRAFTKPPATVLDRFGETAAADVMRGATRGLTPLMFFNPLPHMRNVFETGVLSDPAAAARAALKVVGRAGEGGMDAAREAGAIAPRGAEQSIPGYIKAVPGVKQAYGAANKLLWGSDERLKAELFDAFKRRFEKEGLDPKLAEAKAVERVGQDVVDYGDASDLTRALRYVAPFATYATKKPGIVARAIVRHPERVLALTRNHRPADNPSTRLDNPLSASSPLSNVLLGMDSPERYLRGAAGAPLNDLLGALGAHYFTYGDPGKKPAGWLKLLLSQYGTNLPGSEELINALGLGYFDKK